MEPKGKQTLKLRIPFSGFGSGSHCDYEFDRALEDCVSDDSGTAFPDLHEAACALSFDMDKWNRLYAMEYAENLILSALHTSDNRALWVDFVAESGGLENLISVYMVYGHTIDVTVTRDIAACIRKEAGRKREDWKPHIKEVFGRHAEGEFPPAQLVDFDTEWQEVLLCVALSNVLWQAFGARDEHVLMEHASGNGVYDNWLFDCVDEKIKKKLKTLCKAVSRRRERTHNGKMESTGILWLPLFALPLFENSPEMRAPSAIKYLRAHPLTSGQGWRYQGGKIARIAAWGGRRAAAALKSLVVLADCGEVSTDDFIRLNIAAINETGLGVQDIINRVLYEA